MKKNICLYFVSLRLTYISEYSNRSRFSDICHVQIFLMSATWTEIYIFNIQRRLNILLSEYPFEFLKKHTQQTVEIIEQI